MCKSVFIDSSAVGQEMLLNHRFELSWIREWGQAKHEPIMCFTEKKTGNVARISANLTRLRLTRHMIKCRETTVCLHGGVMFVLFTVGECRADEQLCV